MGTAIALVALAAACVLVVALVVAQRFGGAVAMGGLNGGSWVTWVGPPWLQWLAAPLALVGLAALAWMVVELVARRSRSRRRG